MQVEISKSQLQFQGSIQHLSFLPLIIYYIMCSFALFYFFRLKLIVCYAHAHPYCVNFFFCCPYCVIGVIAIIIAKGFMVFQILSHFHCPYLLRLFTVNMTKNLAATCNNGHFLTAGGSQRPGRAGPIPVVLIFNTMAVRGQIFWSI